MITIYETNNSGGHWWFSQDDWNALINAGWKPIHFRGWVEKAWRELPLKAAIAEFDEVTSQSSSDEGCSCCGHPHYFYEYETLEDSGYKSFPKDYGGELRFAVKG